MKSSGSCLPAQRIDLHRKRSHLKPALVTGISTGSSTKQIALNHACGPCTSLGFAPHTCLAPASAGAFSCDRHSAMTGRRWRNGSAEAFAARGSLHCFVLPHDRRTLAALRRFCRIPSLGDLHRRTAADTRNRFTHSARSTLPSSDAQSP